MNYVIVISFLVLVGCALALTFPKRTILHLGYMNKYDEESIPKSLTRTLYIVGLSGLIISMYVFFYEVSLIDSEFPDILGYFQDLF